MAPSRGIIALHVIPAAMALLTLTGKTGVYFAGVQMVVVFLCGTTLMLLLWIEAKRWTPWIIALALTAAVINPLIPAYLATALGLALNIATAAVFLGHLMAACRTRHPPHHDPPNRGSREGAVSPGAQKKP